VIQLSIFTGGNMNEQQDEEEQQAELDDAERLVIEGVGRVIDFWGFKQNQGRIWALLYVLDEPQAQKQVQQKLDLSKGATSMLIKELKRWDVIAESRPKHQRPTKFEAADDFLSLIQNVFEEREKAFLQEVNSDFQRASELVQQRDNPGKSAERIMQIATLSELFLDAFLNFLENGTLDLSKTSDTL
jgi:DNA-binding transcriptional regulator GbsR (MarR family)